MRVVIADDEALLREGLVRLLTEAGCDVVGTAATAVELRRLVEATAPDVALVDIRMPPTHTDEGLVAAGEIRDQSPATAVLVLSHFVEPRYALRLLESHPGAPATCSRTGCPTSPSWSTRCVGCARASASSTRPS